MKIIEYPILSVGILAGLLLVAYSAAASPFQDVTDGFSDAIGVSSYVGCFILAMAGIASISICLAVAKMPTMGIIIVLLMAIGTFTAIGWLDPWVLILAAVVVALWFASSIKDGVTSA